MELEEAKEQLESLKESIESSIDNPKDLDDIFVQDVEGIKTILKELDRLQKENEELECVKKAIKVYKTDVGTENCQFVLMSENEFLNSFNYKCLLDDYISKDKIKDFIVYNKEKIAENNKEIEECRKTIMEKQELKRLRLYTLHKDNDLLEREIADLFDLLKEE